MIIKVSQDLKKQEIWANGIELVSIMGMNYKKGKRVLNHPAEKKKYVHTFSNPVLMTDNAKIAKLKPALRDTLFSLFSTKPRTVEYDGVSTVWDHAHVNVWCPSIDTILFAKAIKKVLKKRKDFKTAAEIGCGSGFLSKYLLDKNKKIKSLLVNDLNPYAIKCAMDNIKDKRATFYAGDGLEKIKDHKFDLIICNPPYVPKRESIDDNPYEGVDMLNHLLHHGQDYLNPNGIILINISSLSKKLVLKKKPKMKMRLLEKMKVPLKVNNIMNNPSWLKYLQKNGLKKKKSRGYDYWQELFIVSLEN